MRRRRAMVRTLIFILVLASLVAGCGQSRPVEQGTPGGRPDDAEAYYNRGVAYYDKGLYRQAIADFDKAIRLSPGYAKAYYSRGLAYLDEEQYDWAIADFDKAIELQPGYVEAIRGRGDASRMRSEEDRRLRDMVW
jgi:tetratricopeptide (TPR) repeat protein